MRLPAIVCATSAHSYHSFLFFVFYSAICVIPTLGSTWISGSLPTSDHYRRIIKDFFTDWYVVSNTGKLPVNGGLNGHTLCLHYPLCLHCALARPFQSTWGFKSRFFSSSPVFSALRPIATLKPKSCAWHMNKIMWSSLYSTWIGSPAHDYIHVHSFSLLILSMQTVVLTAWTGQLYQRPGSTSPMSFQGSVTYFFRLSLAQV